MGLLRKAPPFLLTFIVFAELGGACPFFLHGPVKSITTYIKLPGQHSVQYSRYSSGVNATFDKKCQLLSETWVTSNHKTKRFFSYEEGGRLASTVSLFGGRIVGISYFPAAPKAQARLSAALKPEPAKMARSGLDELFMPQPKQLPSLSSSPLSALWEERQFPVIAVLDNPKKNSVVKIETGRGLYKLHTDRYGNWTEASQPKTPSRGVLEREITYFS